MTPFQIRHFLRYGDLIALDSQLKRKNNYGWVFCGPAGMNNNKKLVHYAHSFMIAELLGFQEFVLSSMSEISGRKMSDIKLITMDGKFNDKSLRKTHTGKFIDLMNITTIKVSNSHHCFL